MNEERREVSCWMQWIKLNRNNRPHDIQFNRHNVHAHANGIETMRSHWKVATSMRCDASDTLGVGIFQLRWICWFFFIYSSSAFISLLLLPLHLLNVPVGTNITDDKNKRNVSKCTLHAQKSAQHTTGRYYMETPETEANQSAHGQEQQQKYRKNIFRWCITLNRNQFGIFLLLLALRLSLRLSHAPFSFRYRNAINIDTSPKNSRRSKEAQQ